MRKRLFKILPVAAIALTSIVGVSAIPGAESEVPMETYQLNDGTNCFLVPLQADSVDSTSEYVDVAALIDFSAAQLSSDVRKAAQESVDALVANLPKNARVQLFAVSNETEPLTDGYVAVGSPELKEAVSSLKTRDALGAADLERSFSVALNSFDFNENADRSIVFIGRGVSTGAAFNEEVFGETVEKLIDARVPVNSFGVGASVNTKTLGALANRTGGVVVEDGTSAKEAGQKLALATTATVFYPEEGSVTIPNADVYPNPLPPIRSDRETYLFGSTVEPLEDVVLTVPAVLMDGREAEIEWNVVPEPSNKSNQYLYRMVQEAAADGGATFAAAGREILTDSQIAINDVSDQALELAEQAAESGDSDAAQRLSSLVEGVYAAQADEDDPFGDEDAEEETTEVIAEVADDVTEDATDDEDPFGEDEVAESAATVAEEPVVVETKAAEEPVAEEPDAEVKKVEEPIAAKSDAAKSDAAKSDVAKPVVVQPAPVDDDPIWDRAKEKLQSADQANLIQASESNVKVLTQQERTHVAVVIANARKDAKTDPDGAIQDVKLTINAVKNNPVLSAADRAVLLHDLSACGQYISQEREAKALREYTAQKNQAIVDSAIKAQKAYQANQTKVVEIMKRFNSLIEESKFVLAFEAAEEAAKISDDGALPTQAGNIALLRNAYEENQELRIKRRYRLLDVLMSVERAHVPVSDEPPITYPDPEVWLNLTKVRQEKYKTTNLQGSEEEQRIAKALDVKVDVLGGEGSDLTLADWIESIKSTLRAKGQDINVVFDTTNMEEAAGPPSSLNINENLSQITLRKALKLVLRPHELDFCILDDCLYITTQDEIKNNPDISTSLQLYPVGDLIMQPNQMGAQGGGMMMGGMGGMGGGMGGMGGGMWNVPGVNKARPEKGAANDAILKNFLEENTPVAPDTGLFAVPSKSSKAVKSESSKSVQAPKGTLAQAPVDLNAKWDSYIVSKAPKALKDGASEEEAAAYEKAREEFAESLTVEVAKLMKDQPESAAALIRSALRNDCAAPWMYEALAAALIKSNAPQKEVEKAILSVADFNADPLVLMGLAAYLEKVGSQERALKVYRDVSKVYPTRPEPYVRGLALAKELNDEEALKWVALGIASVVWEGKLIEDVQNEGEEIALDLIEKMKNEGRDSEAADFEAKLAEARVRDVVVEISWSGDAELDLAVQEPTSAVCWFAQKRTAAGGVLTEPTVDLRKSYDANRSGVRSRVYTCPMGFSGDYNFLVSKSWGTVAQDKVSVKIMSNVGTDKERSTTQVFELKDDEASFKVQLAEGRRSEEVKEELLTAHDLLNQMQIRSSRELSQRASAFQSRKARNEARVAGTVQSKAEEYSSSYKAEETKAEENDVPQIAYMTPDPGHYAEISYLSLGAGFTTSAGVSGDRRYVLVAPMPMFSQLLYMFTYNTSSGYTSGNSNGNGGYGNNNGNGGYGNNNSNGGYGNNNNNNRGGGNYGGNNGGYGNNSSW